MTKRKRSGFPRARPSLLILVGTWACIPVAHAYHPLVTDDSGTQGGGGNQLELGYDYGRSEAAGVTRIERAIPFTYTRGLTNNLDVFAGVARQTSPGAGWGNVGIGAKWRVFENEAARFSLALKPEILLPVSRAKEAAGFGNGKTSYGLALILTRETDFGEVHVNLAAERGNYTDTVTFPERKNRYRLSLAPVWAAAEGWKLALDMGIQTNPDPAERSRMGYLALGAVYSPGEDLDLSFGVTRDVMDGAVSTTSATFGLTWRFH